MLVAFTTKNFCLLCDFLRPLRALESGGVKKMLFFTERTKPTLRPFVLVLTPLLFLLPLQPALAQESYPRIEIFGGGSYLPSDSMDFPRKNSFGFQTSLSGNVNRWFGVLGDFGGQYSNGSTVYEYLVGPRFTKRTERINVFVHALVGGAHGRTTQRGFSDKGLTLGGGGGFDIRVTRRIAIRPFQLDYIGSFVDILEENLRLGSGIVIRLGGN
jgi:hypothetical protein